MLNPYVCVRFILAPTHYDQLNVLGIKVQGEPLFLYPVQKWTYLPTWNAITSFLGDMGHQGRENTINHHLRIILCNPILHYKTIVFNR